MAHPRSTAPEVGDARVRTTTSAGGVVLTFDDGPDPQWTPGVLEILRRRDVRATFFVLEPAVDEHLWLVHQMLEAGHDVAVHGTTHVDHRALDDAALVGSVQRTASRLRAAAATVGRDPAEIRMFRPPYGLHDRRVVQAAEDAGLVTWLWTVDARDWEHPPSATIVERCTEGLRPGDVVLLHDGRGWRHRTVDALPELVAAVRQAGLQFVQLD